ncbi:hypothetical protein ADICEAN_02831 [Cesiribacter andamanensis AMV16]|uniref:Uncharacterized protein n=1 Tax=Cesiribacter andamanensis AMV16 TaxID=1279009 RepID=M7NU76_9BACT|nr:hypothetical protein ADICEAN_02831 [Cesiribacter andamanensis AMV16]
MNIYAAFRNNKMLKKKVSAKPFLPELGTANPLRMPHSATSARLMKLAKASRQLAKEGGNRSSRLKPFYAGTYSSNS